MNVKIFFVKKFDDYYRSSEKLFEEEVVKKNPELQNAIKFALAGNEVAKNLLYQNIVKCITKKQTKIQNQFMKANFMAKQKLKA